MTLTLMLQNSEHFQLKILQIAPLMPQGQHGNAALSPRKKKKRFNFRIQEESLSLNNIFFTTIQAFNKNSTDSWSSFVFTLQIVPLKVNYNQFHWMEFGKGHYLFRQKSLILTFNFTLTSFLSSPPNHRGDGRVTVETAMLPWRRPAG